MKTKTGVKLSGLKIQMRPVLMGADAVWKKHGHELTITETDGGVHSPRSLHPYGYAVDIRSGYWWGYNQDTVKRMCKELQDALGHDYQVIKHTTHVHVEWEKAKELI